MSMKKGRPVALFTFVQAMGLCAMVIVAVTILAGVIIPVCGSLITAAQEGGSDIGNMLLILLTVTGVGACLMWLLLEFVLMCGRVKKETAFTAANVRALGRIVLAFVIGGVFMLLLGKPMMDWLLLGMRGFRSPVWWLLPAFVAWTAALLVRAIQVLLKRAVDMQNESDLTV
ncbi:MAG: DUF2975 domain-containing protein [Clostridia bacterium]|nr:DUF2975 domain-containing protein [Clostridia bacterium]